MPDAGDRAQPDDHLLVDDQARYEKSQRPEKRVAVVLTRLRVGGDPAGVVVADHDDDPWAEDGEQREQPAPPGAAGGDIAEADGAERAVDVAYVHLVEHG